MTAYGLDDRPGWHALANCGRNGTIGDDPRLRVAIMFDHVDTTVCHGCPVADRCAETARHLPSPDPGGVWAGLLGGQPHRVRRCEVCAAEFTPRGRAVTCSIGCRTERNRRLEAKRSAEYRQRQHAAACCELCGLIRHRATCPNYGGSHRKQVA